MISNSKKPYRVKWMFRKPRADRPQASKPVPSSTIPVVDLSKIPRGLSFEAMDRIIMRRGGASV